jgi:3-hydroxyisobutyrate dehydrogenase/glyoxylate/succinic semialdehyde reductase
MKIGSIGLGIMGSRMAENLQNAATRWSFTIGLVKRRNLLAKGAEWADSPADLASDVEVLFTMLAHPDAVREAALGEDGFLQQLAPGRLWVDYSTADECESAVFAPRMKLERIGTEWKMAGPYNPPGQQSP